MKRFLLFTCCLLFATSQMIAQLSMPSFFSDHMVLQREKPIRIWGTAHSGERISVTLGDIKKSIRADKNGKWLVSLPPMQAGGPYTLTVKSPEQSLSFSDILIGEEYQWAQAKIENNKVIVWNTEIQQPVSVRYAWGDNPDDANLYNSANLPTSPFEGHISQ